VRVAVLITLGIALGIVGVMIGEAVGGREILEELAGLTGDVVVILPPPCRMCRCPLGSARLLASAD